MKSFILLAKRVTDHPIIKSSFVVMVGTMGTNFTAYLYHLVIGRMLGPIQYGELAALLSIFYIVNVPSSVLQTVLTKYFSVLKAREAKGEAKTLFIESSKWVLIGILVGFIILLPFTNSLGKFLHLTTPLYFVWLYLIFVSFLLGVIQMSALQGFQMFFSTSLFTNIGTFLRLVFGIIGAIFGVGGTLLSNMLSNIAMYFVTFLPLRPILASKSKPFTLEKTKAIGYSAPTLLSLLGMTAIFSQDVILVKHFFTAQDAGMYSALSVLGKVVFYASSALGFVLFPVVAARKEQKKGHKSVVWLSLLAIGGMSLFITLFYFIFPKFVIDLFWGASFYHAIPYLGIFGIFISFFSLSSLLTNVLLASDKTNVWIFATLAAVLQLGGLWLYHDTIFNVIYVNLGISVALFATLLIYYSYDKRAS